MPICYVKCIFINKQVDIYSLAKVQSRTLQQNQLVSNIDVITIESKAYKEIVAKIDVIANYVFSQEDTKNEDEIWVDSYEVCTFLKISDRTLQRLRAAGLVSYSDIKGHYFYKIKEIKRLLEERLIKRDKEYITI